MYREKTSTLNINFIGTYNFLEGINSFFCKENKIRKIKNKDIYEIHYGGNLQVKKFLDCLYKDSNIYLDRKYEKYLTLKNCRL